DALSHRELLICALAASYKTKKQATRQMQLHKDVHSETDKQVVDALGTILLLAIALDRSQTQAERGVSSSVQQKKLRMELDVNHDPSIEVRELKSMERDLKKLWNVQLEVVHAASTP